MTFKEVVESFNSTTAALNILFKEFRYGTHLEYSRAIDIVYPSVYFENNILITYLNDYSSYNCALVFSDKSFEDLSNRIDIESRLVQMAKTYIYTYNNLYQDTAEIVDVSFFIAEEQGNDRVYFVRAEFKLNVMNDIICDDITNINLTC